MKNMDINLLLSTLIGRKLGKYLLMSGNILKRKSLPLCRILNFLKRKAIRKTKILIIKSMSMIYLTILTKAKICRIRWKSKRSKIPFWKISPSLETKKQLVNWSIIN